MLALEDIMDFHQLKQEGMSVRAIALPYRIQPAYRCQGFEERPEGTPVQAPCTKAGETGSLQGLYRAPAGEFPPLSG